MMFAAALMFAASSIQAQVSVGTNINVGNQPAWGPAGHNYAEYYYIPDIETYYHVPRKQFVYLYGDRWIYSAVLPPAHAQYDLYSGYKVVLKEPKAYKYFNSHKVKYAKYKGYKNKQPTYKYKQDNGKHKGHYKDKGKSKGKSKGKH